MGADVTLSESTGNRPPGRERLSPSGRRTFAISKIVPFIDRARGFSGWSFDDLKVTNLEDSEPWDYVAIAREHLPNAQHVIDMGTGGGEIYSRIIDGFDDAGERFFASEEWDINAPVARERLAPIGVNVVNASSERTPWADASFDLILSRHEAIIPAEIARILRPGGVFITQQVAKEQWQELAEFIPNRTVFPDHFVDYRREFEAAGMTVSRAEHRAWRAAYATLGEVVYMLLMSPWEFESFDPIRDLDALLALEDKHGTPEGIVLTHARYLMIAARF
jgi:SAM-dependent methyltransferase